MEIKPPVPVFKQNPNEGAPKAPRIKVIEECDFPIIEKEVNGYKVVVLPPTLQHYFDVEGYDALRINSVKVVEKLPHYGGKTMAKQSLLPHQDHLPTDPRRFLALSKNNGEDRGSSTYIAHPETIRRTLPKFLNYFNEHRDTLKKIFVYDKSSKVSEEELMGCFEPGGLDALMEKLTDGNTDPTLRLFGTIGILGYLIQGEHADNLVKEFLEENKDEVAAEDWTKNGTFIIDNSKVFHGRFGSNNNALQRNWMVAE
jgi:hypothetical protein